MPRAAHPDLARWAPVGAAAALLVVVIGVGMAGRGGGEAGASTSSAPPSVPAQEAPAATAAPSTVAPTVTVPLGRTLGDGVTGDDVRMVQERLTELGFDPGPVDGAYGGQTIQAVWAFEKLVLGTPRAAATGRVTPELWDAMQAPDLRVVPRRPTGGLGDHIEIYLPEQVLVIFHADRPALIAHISSGELDAAGNPAYYCEESTWDTDQYGNSLPEPITGESCAEAKTPGGVFEINRMVQGKRVSPLGGMMNPAYFNYGIAIHGADNVPLEPASHGCIRMNQYLGGKFQALIDFGDKVLVWGHDGKQPEDYTDTESLPYFDRRTPYTTTTTTSTTTTTTSNTTSTTTASAPPASTTTVAAPATTPAGTTSTSAPSTTVAAITPSTAP